MLLPDPVTLTVVPVPFILIISVLLSLPVKTISGLLPLVVGNVYVVLSLVSAGKVIVLRFKAVILPVVLEVTLSTAVNVAPAAGLAVEVLSDLVIAA